MTWRNLVDRSDGHIARLADGFRQRVASWYQELTLKKIPVLIYCSVREPWEQDALYAIGRTEKGNKVTNARGTPVPQSFHCYGRAIDAVPCASTAAGQYTPCWDDETTYQIMRNAADKHKLRYLTFETPHFEDGNFKDWRELAASESIGTRVAEKNRQAMQAKNIRVSKSPTKRVRKVSLRKP